VAPSNQPSSKPMPHAEIVPLAWVPDPGIPIRHNLSQESLDRIAVAMLSFERPPSVTPCIGPDLTTTALLLTGERSRA